MLGQPLVVLLVEAASRAMLDRDHEYRRLLLGGRSHHHLILLFLLQLLLYRLWFDLNGRSKCLIHGSCLLLCLLLHLYDSAQDSFSFVALFDGGCFLSLQ